MSAPAIEKRLWAPIRIGAPGRPDWPVWNCIRYTRRDAKAALLDSFSPEYHKTLLKDFRFARVTVQENT